MRSGVVPHTRLAALRLQTGLCFPFKYWICTLPANLSYSSCTALSSYLKFLRRHITYMCKQIKLEARGMKLSCVQP